MSVFFNICDQRGDVYEHLPAIRNMEENIKMVSYATRIPDAILLKCSISGISESRKSLSPSDLCSTTKLLM